MRECIIIRERWMYLNKTCNDLVMDDFSTEFSLEFELGGTIVNNIIYKNYISKRVKNDIEKGIITEDEIGFAMMSIPDEVYTEEYGGTFLVESKGMQKRLLITKEGINFIVLLVEDTEDFSIY